MVSKSSRMMGLVFLVLFATFQSCFSAANQPPSKIKSTHPMAANALGSSVVFLVTGNVYPLGYYYANVYMGNPLKLYDLDIDTGSDLTWVQCDAPCTGCTKPPDRLYKPKNNLLVRCADPLCAAIQWPENHHCATPNDQCDYEVDYADNGSSLGVLVKDNFQLKLTNGSVVSPGLAFGCGYDQKNPNPAPNTAGVLGLGNGKISIVSQLRALGLTRNVVGHCLSGQGGYLFIGDDLVPSSGIVWTPILRNNLEKHYLTGPAELFLGGKTTGVKGLQLIFDSGSSYTYLNSQVYQTVVNLVRKDLNGKPLKEVKDGSLPICWKGAKPFKSIQDVKNYFKPFVLSFTNGRNVQLQIPPEGYLVVTKYGNVCLGILRGTEAGLQNFNIIGDISLQDKMVIYDNEKLQIGWIPANCNRLSNQLWYVGRDSQLWYVGRALSCNFRFREE